MKRSLEHNLLLCLSGLLIFWCSQIAYTIVKVGYGYECAMIYFLGQAISYVLVSMGIMFICKGNKLFGNVFFFFFLLSIANLGNEITFDALKFDIKEFWYASAIGGFVLVKMSNKREHI